MRSPGNGGDAVFPTQASPFGQLLRGEFFSVALPFSTRQRLSVNVFLKNMPHQRFYYITGMIAESDINVKLFLEKF